jgi:5'-phosphate synthase pdxT subunit
MPSPRPVIGVLALQGDVREHLRALEAADADVRSVRRPEELAQVHGLVIPGGESTTMSRLLESFELLDPLRERLETGMPAYGACAGMILLARDVLDGRPDQRQLDALNVVVRRNAFGRQVDSFESGLDFEGLAEQVHAVFIRAPWVESAADGVDVLARVPEETDHGRAAGKIVAIRQGPVMATSFHPELTADGRMHRLFVETVYAA